MDETLLSAFRPASFLQFSPTGGVTAGEARAVVVTEDLIRGIWSALERRVGQAAAGEMLFDVGLAWGGTFYNRFSQAVCQLLGTPVIESVAAPDFLACLTHILCALGMGRVELVPDGERLFVNLISSPFVDSLKDQAPLANKLYAGFFAGLFTPLAGVELSAVEDGSSGETTRFLLLRRR